MSHFLFCNSRLLQVEATEASGMNVKQTVMVVMHTFPRMFNWHHLFLEAFDKSNRNILDYSKLSKPSKPSLAIILNYYKVDFFINGFNIG